MGLCVACNAEVENLEDHAANMHPATEGEAATENAGEAASEAPAEAPAEGGEAAA